MTKEEWLEQLFGVWMRMTEAERKHWAEVIKKHGNARTKEMLRRVTMPQLSTGNTRYLYHELHEYYLKIIGVLVMQVGGRAVLSQGELVSNIEVGTVTAPELDIAVVITARHITKEESERRKREIRGY